MTDSDLYMLYREEQRLYRAYVESLSEESRWPSKTARKREAWEAMYRKLQVVLPAKKLRELLQSDVVARSYKDRLAASKKARQQPVLELDVEI
jgi:hypothetical protein